MKVKFPRFVSFGVLCFALWTACLPVQAQEAERRAKIAELLRLTHTEQTYEQVMQQALQQSKTQVEQMLTGVFPDHKLTPAQQEQMDTLQERMAAVITQGISWKSLEPEFIDLYEKAYTADELNGLLAFYRTPLAQSVIAKTPQMLRDSSALVQQHMAVVQPQLVELIQESMKNVRPTAKQQETP